MWATSYESYQTLSGHDHFAFNETPASMANRIQEWTNFYILNGFLPPGSVTESGMMVDGHHRLRVARNNGIGLPCVVVYPHNGVWAISGKVAYVI